MLHLPGELFVEYQLAAQKLRPDLFVAMAAYGDYGPGYIGTEVAYPQGGYETGPQASLVAPERRGRPDGCDREAAARVSEMRMVTGVDPRQPLMKLVATGLFACLVISAVIVCSPEVVQGRRGLSAEEARNALIELLQKDPTAFQRKLDWRELAKQPLAGVGAGRYTCGAFRISLPDATYQITVRYGCAFEYAGTFRFEDDRWIASKPQWTSAALVK